MKLLSYWRSAWIVWVVMGLLTLNRFTINSEWADWAIFGLAFPNLAAYTIRLDAENARLKDELRRKP